MTVVTIVALVVDIIALAGLIPTIIGWVLRIANGQKCLLRSDMLRIYYHHRDEKEIRQFEYENFVELYEGYKALKGNSFIDKIYSEVQTWEIVS